MSILGIFGAEDERGAEAAAFLQASGLFEAADYCERAGLPTGSNAALHYLQYGWQRGLEPNAGFDGAFLQPYYAACGYRGPPGLTWAELALLGGAPLATDLPSAEAAAALVRTIPIFDAPAYARQLPEGLDPALHYVVIGERLGWRPAADFDPAVYGEMYPDIVEAGVSQLVHYWFHGRQEERVHVAAADRLDFPALPPGDARPVVIVVSHEASRTGAPILGWNIIEHLSRSYRVVSLLMHGGVLEPDFASLATVQVGPMQRSEWRAPQMRRMAERLVATYRPLFAVTNSVETHLLVPALAKVGVPSVALVHEFMSYTGDAQEKMDNLFDWAPNVVFPARIVAQSSFDRFARLEHRHGVLMQPQGQAKLPATRAVPDPAKEGKEAAKFRRLLRPEGCENAFLVLGAGTVEIRKGTDLFIATAAALRRQNSELPIRFVWIGSGFDPVNDKVFSSFLADQIQRSGLQGSVVMLDPVSDLEPAYEEADAFFMCSRLDPQPNVGIDALTRGIPTVCFGEACGTGEVLAADPATRHLVVPYLDVQAAANLLQDLATDPERTLQLREEVRRVGLEAFDMSRYVAMLETVGRKAAEDENDTDVFELAQSAVLDRDMICKPGVEIVEDEELARYSLRQWSLWNMLGQPHVSTTMRRPMKGFHPQAYARLHPELDKPDGLNPVLHWLRNGRPVGSWSHHVHAPGPNTPAKGRAKDLRIALHGHFYYTDDAAELASRLSRNEVVCDVFLTTGSDKDALFLESAFGRHSGSVDVRIVPNRGRDIGPLLTELGSLIAGDDYDLIGHVHGKKTHVVGGGVGDRWRTFLWENLIGGQHAMLDFVASVMADDPEIGLMIAADPHLVGWDDNFHVASDLASRMGLPTPLDDFFDFPLGTMFWARPAALKPILDLRLGWDDYPEEPMPYDGTILHAIERLLPFVARHSGYRMDGLHVPETTW